MKATRPQLAMLRSLRTRKGRDAEGLFLIEGKRLCSELLDAGVTPAYLLLSTQQSELEFCTELAERFRARGATVLTAPARDFDRVSDTVQSQGIIAAAAWTDTPPDCLSFPRRAVVVALDRVSDPGNVGTVIRTAAWFGASAVWLGAGCADLLNPKVVRATMGGMFHLPVCRDITLEAVLPSLKGAGFRLVAAAADGSPEWRSWAAERSVLLLGSEAHGLDARLRSLADATVAIPRRGDGESLNVAVCAGILLAAACR